LHLDIEKNQWRGSHGGGVENEPVKAKKTCVQCSLRLGHRGVPLVEEFGEKRTATRGHVGRIARKARW